jgi:polysaccharide export outer membrane protein
MSMTCLFLVAALLGPATLPQEAQTPTAVETRPGEGTPFRLGPEDTIQVWLWQEPELGTTATVRPDGRISLPLLHEIEVTGKTPIELQDELTERYKEFLGDPVVTVIVSQIRSSNINVLGEVRAVGRYPLLQDLTIVDAIALAGGLADFTDGKEVIIWRPGPNGIERIEVNLKKMLEDGEGTPLKLKPSDTIFVK